MWGEKTACGSIAVFLVAVFTMYDVGDWVTRIFLGIAITIGEAVGGDYDNLCIAAVSIGAW